MAHKGLRWLESVRLSPPDRHLYTYLEWCRRPFAKVNAAMRLGVPTTFVVLCKAADEIEKCLTSS